jgi:hypothetical protein
MNFKKLSLMGAAGAITLLTACNLFNPNGAEQGSCPGDDAECYVALGQSLVQQENFDAAMAAYGKAAEIDSSKSEAYWGYATAASFKYNVNLGSLLDDLESAAGGDPSAFTEGKSNAELTARIRVSKAVLDAMERLSDRDTLSKWYGYIKDSTNAGVDPKFAQRRAFIIHYLDTVTAPSRQREMFPLSDRKKIFNDAIIQFAPYKMMYTILNLYDLDPVGTFDDHDRIMMNLLGKDGNLGDITDLAEQMKTDTVLKAEVNDKILQLQTGLGDVAQLLSYFGGAPSDTAGASAQTQSKGQMDSAITSLGGALVFYQFGDKLDNDADGCIDEEFIDSLDNDLDGFVDEDARLINGNGVLIGPTATGPADNVDNDHSGSKDAADAGENKLGGFTGAKDVLTYVVISGRGDNFVLQPAHKDGPRMDYRIALQSDSLAVHLATSGTPAPGTPLRAKLDSAKTLVGGCWTNY